MRFLRLVILFSVIFFQVQAQQVIIRAFSDTNAIRVGEQFTITLSVKGPVGTRFVFPNLNDTITSHFEVVKILKPDTLISEDKTSITINQQYLVTSFDSGYWPVPPFKVYVLPDTARYFETEAFLITVNTVEVDTTKEIKDIKQPLSVPISWQEWVPYVAGILAVLVVAYLWWYFYKKRKNKKLPELELPQKSPAEIALERLQDLYVKQLWQQEQYKEYFSELIDIIKSYFDAKYNINTREQITDDTLRVMHAYLSQDDLHKLKRALKLADMVKFAKVIPLANQCENSFADVKEIIHSTSVIINEVPDAK